ncbi:uncharacterized protein CBL_12054 [Carabus blaptoides fortunei]
MQHKTTILVAPALQNSSCSHPRYAHVSMLSALTPGDVLQAVIVLCLTTGVLAANMLLIFVINSRRYAKYIHSQPRYLLTSLASNDLAMGLLVTPFAIVPSLRHCWPYGELVCQIQKRRYLVILLSVKGVVGLQSKGYLYKYSSSSSWRNTIITNNYPTTNVDLELRKGELYFNPETSYGTLET